MPLTVIGTDGGLLPAAVAKSYVMLMPGERVDLWVDIAPLTGQQVELRSLDFVAGHGMMGGGMGMMGGGMMGGGGMYGGPMGGYGMYGRPAYGYSRPYGYGYGGGLGLPIMGGLAGGALLGGLLF